MLMGLQKIIGDFLDDEDNDLIIKHEHHNIQDTSREAYHDLIKHPHEIHGRQLEVLTAIHEINSPCTDQEIKRHLGKVEPNYVRPRRFELVTFGFVEPFIKRECKITGKKVITWKITSQGLNYLNNNGGNSF